LRHRGLELSDSTASAAQVSQVFALPGLRGFEAGEGIARDCLMTRGLSAQLPVQHGFTLELLAQRIDWAAFRCRRRDGRALP
jgi:hypothetical protein